MSAQTTTGQCPMHPWRGVPCMDCGQVSSTIVNGHWENELIAIGRCSLCGGSVMRPRVTWTDGMGNTNARSRCANCGALEAPPEVQALPVIPMVKS